MQMTDLIGWAIILYVFYRIFVWARDDLRLWDNGGGQDYYYRPDQSETIRPPPPLGRGGDYYRR